MPPSTHPTALPHPQHTTAAHRQKRSEDEEKRGRATRDRGGQHNTHTPAIQQDHHANRRGTQHTRRGGQQRYRPSPTMPPTIHDGPTLHHCEGGADRGYPTTRTPQTLTTHTPHTWQRTVHDMTAVLASTAAGRVGHEPHHCTGQDSSSTHHRHSTHRGGWTPSTHPFIHSHSFTFTHSTNNNDQRTTINVQ